MAKKCKNWPKMAKNGPGEKLIFWEKNISSDLALVFRYFAHFWPILASNSKLSQSSHVTTQNDRKRSRNPIEMVSDVTFQTFRPFFVIWGLFRPFLANFGPKFKVGKKWKKNGRPAGEFAEQEGGVDRGGHRSSSQPLFLGRYLLAVHPQASTSSSTCRCYCSSIVVLVVERSTCPLPPAGTRDSGFHTRSYFLRNFNLKFWRGWGW